MFCSNCGKEISDDAKFCPNCGAEQIKADKGHKEEAKPKQPQDDNTKTKEKKGFPKKALISIIICVAAALVVIFIAIGVRRSNKIDLNDYVEVEFNGYDGYGTAKVSFDWNSLSQEYDDRVKINSSGWGWMFESFSELLEECAYMYAEPTSGLSNGDQVTVNWDVDTEDLYEVLRTNIKIVSEPKTFTVSGLEEVQDFDAFAGVSVEFSGFSPNATASLSVDGGLGDQLTYTLDRTSDLAIGDIVTVTIDEASAYSYMLEYGLYPEEMSKDFTVSGIAEVQNFDAFAGVSVEFSGFSPNATASLSVDGRLGDQLTYTLDQTSGLANGDTVTVTIDEASAYSYMLEYGLYPEEMSKDFTVSGIEEVQDFDAFEGVSIEYSGFSPNATASLSVEGELGDQLKYSLNKTSGLANGDTVTVTINEKTANAYMLVYGLYPEEMSKDFTVSGIAEVQDFDAFAGVSIEYSGISPNATASLSVEGELGDQLTYTLSQTSDLAFGDTVTVTIDEESANAYMLEYGLYPEELSKEYVVDNVAHYVLSLDEIPEEGMEKLKDQAEDVFMASAASWDSNAQFESLDYLGSYFLHIKPDVSSSKVNMIYMVYNIHAKQFGKTESGSQTETDVNYYWYICFQNGMVLADGTFSIDYSDYQKPKYTYLSSSEGFAVTTYDYTKSYSYQQEISLSYGGYENLDSMFNNLVVTKINNYTYESTVSDMASGGNTDTGDSVGTDETE